MTIKSYTKVVKQLKTKPDKLKKYLKHNKPKERSFGKFTKKCSRCGNMHGFVDKYGLKLCRKCFREHAVKLGFKKYT